MKFLALLCCLQLLLVSTGCDGMGQGGPDPFATEILAAYADPETVIAGDMTLLQVVIRDSTETGFKYRWTWNKEVRAVDTEVPRYEWIANVDPGQYIVSVQVTKGGLSPVGEFIHVTVASGQ